MGLHVPRSVSPSGDKHQRRVSQPKTLGLVLLELVFVPTEEVLGVSAIHRRNKVRQQVMQSLAASYQ